MAMQTFVNLPVKDLKRAREFFTSVGFSFDDQFTDENATRMIVRRYQELECWRLANQVKREVYAIIARPRSRKISNFAIKFASQRGLGRATSPKDLVRFRPAENARFCEFAKGSLVETDNHILDALDQQYVTKDEWKELTQLIDRAIGATTKYIVYLKGPGRFH